MFAKLVQQPRDCSTILVQYLLWDTDIVSWLISSKVLLGTVCPFQKAELFSLFPCSRALQNSMWAARRLQKLGMARSSQGARSSVPAHEQKKAEWNCVKYNVLQASIVETDYS